MKIFKYFLSELPTDTKIFLVVGAKGYLLSRPEPKIETSLGRKWSCTKQVHDTDDMHNFVNINKSITKITTSSTSIVTNIRYE